jgi:hypothetical protein
MPMTDFQPGDNDASPHLFASSSPGAAAFGYLIVSRSDERRAAADSDSAG